MNKRAILITGTPGVGKTQTAKKLALKLKADYINLTELAKNENLKLYFDEKRNTIAVDESKMRKKLTSLIVHSKKDVIIDGHYAAAVVPKKLVTNVFVLRRNPMELIETLQARGYSKDKQKENVSSEILDVCLIEAVQKQETTQVCEIDGSGKTIDEIVTEIFDVLLKSDKCRKGIVDWLGLLEKEGKISEYLET
jgi:adenylate kinase